MAGTASVVVFRDENCLHMIHSWSTNACEYVNWNVNRTLPNTLQQWRVDILNWGAIHCLRWLLHCWIYFITSPFFLLLLCFVFLFFWLPFSSLFSSSASSAPSSILLVTLLSSLLFSTPLSPLVFLSSPSSFTEYHAELIVLFLNSPLPRLSPWWWLIHSVEMLAKFFWSQSWYQRTLFSIYVGAN